MVFVDNEISRTSVESITGTNMEIYYSFNPSSQSLVL
jgi:hypothetical protein